MLFGGKEVIEVEDYYQDGYNHGYDDAINGRENRCAGMLYDFLSFLNEETQDQWEAGYRDGYNDGVQNR